MAWANGRGLAWARIVSAVFFGIATADLAVALAREQRHGQPGPSAWVAWAAGFGAIVLIFSKESRPFYRPGWSGPGPARR